MLFVKTEDLKPGMRLAKPIYNRNGVMLYERNSKITSQGIISVNNFGLIGIYILEPAEPVPPMSEDDIEFERFQAMSIFEIKEILDEEEMSILNKLINPDKSIKLTTLDYTKPDDNEELLRISANKVLNSYSLISPLIIGGNADTSSSTKIYLNELAPFTKDNYIGRNINFGVR